MALFGAILLILLGIVALFVAGAMLSVRTAVTQFLDGIPKLVREMAMESDPKMQKALRMIERLPMISTIVALSGLLVFLIGLALLHNLIAAISIFVLVAIFGTLFWLNRSRLTDLLKQQFVDQMKKQAANAPRPTQAQARDQFRALQERARAQASAAPPTNRSQRRAAQRRGTTMGSTEPPRQTTENRPSNTDKPATPNSTPRRKR